MSIYASPGSGPHTQTKPVREQIAIVCGLQRRQPCPVQCCLASIPSCDPQGQQRQAFPVSTLHCLGSVGLVVQGTLCLEGPGHFCLLGLPGRLELDVFWNQVLPLYAGPCLLPGIAAQTTSFYREERVTLPGRHWCVPEASLCMPGGLRAFPGETRSTSTLTSGLLLRKHKAKSKRL